ncbi:MAG: hypothetical protein JO141_07320 [Bradyrhizobium sp.]|nr:hypothetical protein [Bradyrhizobium sp.]
MATGNKKDQLIAQIARHISSSPRLDADWKSASLVFTFEQDGLSNFGYSYLNGGESDWKAFSTTSDELDDDVIRLREVMKDESKAPWHQALFQLIRDRAEMKIAKSATGRDSGCASTSPSSRPGSRESCFAPA